jgi:hypothetical protein
VQRPHGAHAGQRRVERGIGLRQPNDRAALRVHGRGETGKQERRNKARMTEKLLME